MLISQNGIDLIKKFEGCILQSYDDLTEKKIGANDKVIGTLTIGYGHTGNIKKGQVITQLQADQLLKNDLVYSAHEVQKLIDNGTIMFSVNQNMFDALTSFTFNCGQGNLFTLVYRRTTSEVCEKMLLYNKSKGKELRGLTKRRIEEVALFQKSTQSGVKTYVVKKGDNLTVISKRLKVTIKHIVCMNYIKDINKIYVGQVLKY